MLGGGFVVRLFEFGVSDVGATVFAPIFRLKDGLE